MSMKSKLENILNVSNNDFPVVEGYEWNPKTNRLEYFRQELRAAHVSPPPTGLKKCAESLMHFLGLY